MGLSEDGCPKGKRLVMNLFDFPVGECKKDQRFYRPGKGKAEADTQVINENSA